MSRFTFFFLVTALVASAYAYYAGQQQQEIVLNHILALETRIATHNTQAHQAATNTVRVVAYCTCLNRISLRDDETLRLSQQILVRTQLLTDTLQALRKQLRARYQEPASGPLHEPSTAVSISPNTIDDLSQHLNRYIAFILHFVSETPPASKWIAAVAVVQQVEQFYAPDAPLSATLAALTWLEWQVRRAGAAALLTQASRSGRSVDWYDEIAPFIASESWVVVPGTVYSAQLFVEDTGLHYCTYTSVNGRVIDHAPRNLVEFKVPLQSPESPRTISARWHGAIQALANPEAEPYAADSTWQLDVPYFIVKPAAP